MSETDNAAGRDRVLVVDDEQAILNAAKCFLELHAFTVDTATEREEAEAMISVLDYALIIADLRLTGVHGREGLELVRLARERCPLARIIIMTGFGSQDIEDEARRCGADVLVEKPISLRELLATACRLLGRPIPSSRQRGDPSS